MTASASLAYAAAVPVGYNYATVTFSADYLAGVAIVFVACSDMPPSSATFNGVAVEPTLLLADGGKGLGAVYVVPVASAGSYPFTVSYAYNNQVAVAAWTAAGVTAQPTTIYIDRHPEYPNADDPIYGPQLDCAAGGIGVAAMFNVSGGGFNYGGDTRWTSPGVEDFDTVFSNRSNSFWSGARYNAASSLPGFSGHQYSGPLVFGVALDPASASPPGGVTLSVAAASIAATASPVQLLHGYRLPVTPATITATTNPVATRAARRLPVGATAFALATKVMAIVRGRRLAVDPAAFALSTSPVQTRTSRQLTVSAASFLITTRAVGLIYGTTIGIVGSSIAVTPGAVDLRVRRLLRVGPAAIAATTGPVRVALLRRLRVAAASIAVTLAAVALRLATGFAPAPSAGRTITLVDRGSRTLVVGDQGSRRLII